MSIDTTTLVSLDDDTVTCFPAILTVGLVPKPAPDTVIDLVDPSRTIADGETEVISGVGIATKIM